MDPGVHLPWGPFFIWHQSYWISRQDWSLFGASIDWSHHLGSLEAANMSSSWNISFVYGYFNLLFFKTGQSNIATIKKLCVAGDLWRKFWWEMHEMTGHWNSWVSHLCMRLGRSVYGDNESALSWHDVHWSHYPSCVTTLGGLHLCDDHLPSFGWWTSGLWCIYLWNGIIMVIDFYLLRTQLHTW